MAGNTRKMAEARQQELNTKWEALAPSFTKATKDHDNIFTTYIAENELDEAANKVNEYSSCMLEAKQRFKEIRMMIKEINPEDSDSVVVKSFMEKWETYLLLYKSPAKNFGKAQTFKKNRLKVEQEKKKEKVKKETEVGRNEKL